MRLSTLLLLALPAIFAAVSAAPTESGEITTSLIDDKTTENPVEATTILPADEATEDSGEVTTSSAEEGTSEDPDVD